MTIQAALPDGTILEFEEGTPDDVIDRVVRQQMQQSTAASAAPVTEAEPAEEPVETMGPDIGTGEYYDVPSSPNKAGFESALEEYYRALPKGVAPDEAKLGEMAQKYGVGAPSNVPEILEFYQQYGTLNPQVNIKGPESIPPPPPAIEDIVGTLEPADINTNRARAFAKGVLFDFGDEAEALGRVLGVDPSMMLRGPSAFFTSLGQNAAQKFMAGELTADEYYRAKNQINTQYNAYAKANPGEALGLEVAGGVAGTFVPGLGVVGKGVQLGRGAGALGRGILGGTSSFAGRRAAVAGGSTGALSGLGQAETMALSDIAPSVLEQATIGTVFGGGLGKGFDMIGRRFAPRAGTGTPEERRAAEMLFEATEGGVSPQRAVGATRASQAFDVPTPFGMATPELAALAERVVAKGKPSSRDLGQTLVETQAGVGERVAQQAREALPTSRDFFDAQGAITQRLRQIGEQDYQKAFEVGTVRDPQIESIIQNPELASIWKEAQSLARLGGRELNVKLEAVFDEAGTLVGVKPTQDAIPDVEALDYFKRALDDQIDAGFRGKASGGKSRAAALRDNIRKPLLERLDDLVPEYKEARSKYAGDLEVREALDYGRDMLSKKFRPQEVQQRLGEMSIAEREAVKTGALQAVLEPLEDATRRGNVAQQIIGAGTDGTSKLAKLKAVMAPDEYDFFETAMRLERDLYNRASKATGGSRTVPLAEGVAQLDALIGAGRLEDAVNFVMAGPQGRAASLARWVSRFDPRREFGDKVYGQLSKALTAKDPQELTDVLGLLSRSESYARFVGDVGDVAAQRVAPVAGGVAPSLVEDRSINPPPAVAIGEKGADVEDAIAAAQSVIDAPLASEEVASEAEGGEPEVSTMTIDGREAIYDPTADSYIFTDTNEFVTGYKRGGAVKGYKEGGDVGETAFQKRQRERAERQAAASRRVQQQMEAERQQKLAANQRNIERAQAEGRGRTVSEGRGYNTNAARARTGLQGLTFGSGDEMEAALREGASALTEGRLPTLAGYYGVKDDINEGLERYATDNPGEALLFEGGGAALTGFIPGAQGATAARLAALASRYPTRAALARLGAESAAYGVGTADRVSDIPRSVIEEGLLASLVYGGTRAGGAGIRKAGEFVTRAPDRGATQSPIENVIAYPDFIPEGAPASILAGRPMRSAEDATYVSRNLSPAELEDALASGVFRMPQSGQTKHGEGKKWWSPADEEGVFGRRWAKGTDTVRVPMAAFTPNAPLSVKAAQRWDDELGAWVPMTSGETRKARGGLAVKKAKKK